MSRTIFHVDVNSAYLSWKAVQLLAEDPSAADLRTLPAVIGGDEAARHGVVLAKSIPAKKYGIQTGEPLVSARKKCPGLIVEPPDFPYYVRCSQSFIRILKEYSPVVEQVSIDEAFCDMSGMERLYGPPEETARALADRVRTELGFTVNVGISENRLLAKMASDFTKPDRVHTLYRSEIADKMWPLDVGDLFLVGRATRQKLRTLGIRTIGDLARTDPAVLRSHLKKQGEIIWNYANGIDDTPVTAEKEDNKCVGHSITIPHDVTSEEEAERILAALAEMTAERLRSAGQKARCLSVTIRGTDFRDRSHQCMLPAATDITSELTQKAGELFREIWQGEPIRLLGVSTSHLTDTEEAQISLFADEGHRKKERLDRMLDHLHSRFGADSVVRASRLSAPSPNSSLSRVKQQSVPEITVDPLEDFPFDENGD